MTEAEYRALPIDSYSTIKTFLEDRKKYYKQYILEETVKKDESDELTFGNLVDCLRFTPDQFENKFAMALNMIPTGQYAKFVDALMEFTLASINPQTGEVTRSMDDMMTDAYNKVKHDRDGNIIDFKRDTLEKAKENFLNPEKGLKSYYDQRRNNIGKDVIDLTMVESANRLVASLAENFVTRDIFNARSDGEDIKVLDQFPIIGELSASLTNSNPYPLKGLLDKVIIDRIARRILIYDLKTCWDNETAFITNYFKYKYYIQAAIYYYLMRKWKRTQRGLEDYTVVYPQFIVADSTSYKNPLIYQSTEKSILQGMRGFTRGGKYYPGVIKAVQDLQWHRSNGIWNMSRDNHVNNGLVPVPLFE